MESACSKPGLLLGVCLSLLLSGSVSGQQDLGVSEVPSNFNLDMKTAAGLRPKLMDQSVPATGRYATGRAVFDQLEKVVPASPVKFSWQLRIVEDDQLDGYSSPDGTVYVESGLARLAGSSAGLWAAILSHEIAHVIRRDWARRYLYQKYLENRGGGGIVLGDPGLPAASWSDSENAAADMGRFCRQLELEADREGLMLMARAGYHPDFVPALHHLMHAKGVGSKTRSIYAMHPRWEERDHELSRDYVAASIEFARASGRSGTHRLGEIRPWWFSRQSQRSRKPAQTNGSSRFRCTAKTWQAQWKSSLLSAPPRDLIPS